MITPTCAGGRPFWRFTPAASRWPPDVGLDRLAKQTPGFSGADLNNLLNEAAILAARRDKQSIMMSELEEAIDRVILGPERKSRVISDRERQLKAYHEVGHALVAKMLPEEDTVYKLTIVARGIAGGYTALLPEEDRMLTSRVQAEARLAFSLGGRTAEEIVFGEVTTGATDDLERATELARRMVTQWGMSSKLGPRTFGKKEELVFLGRDISETRNYSEATALLIDQEISDLIDVAHERARDIIVEHRDRLDDIAAKLLEVETLDAEAFHAMFDGEAPVSDQTDESEPADEASEAEEAEPEEQPKQQPRPIPAPS